MKTEYPHYRLCWTTPESVTATKVSTLPYQYTCARCGALVPYGQPCPHCAALHCVAPTLYDAPANAVEPARGIVVGCLVSFGLWCVILVALDWLWS